jgi:hypothetical protein
LAGLSSLRFSEFDENHENQALFGGAKSRHRGKCEAILAEQRSGMPRRR